ncbi:uncharacterized protein LOC119431360 isoform X1 [Dermacentor silvarum]|uniref:uncharacterized protein LOC119431360 isoform X1 n=1 Tax=Dermacentor silvarum TaxID=543639 RepID=UPI00189A37F9|nr:uncharacterized protein LOC119431360 isoform X1 [Dermacentor silvarum]
MFSSPGVFILLFPLACGDTIDTCSSEDSLSSIASHFRQYPNARKLINHTESLYCLVYHSADANFRHNMPCLCARVSFSGTSAESLTFLYQYSPNKTHLYTGVAQAHTNRTDKAYPVDNQIIIKYVIDYNLHREIIRILFTDYYSCVVLNSTLLGTMLWVKLDHLLKEEQMPYLCTLTYQLAAEDIRHVVYDWKVCPEMRSYKENTKRPNVGQKREPQ